MHLTQIMEIPYGVLPDLPVSVTLTTDMALVYLCRNGEVHRYDTASGTDTLLFDTVLSYETADGTKFDPAAPVDIYTLNGYTAVVNRFGTFGFLHRPVGGRTVVLQRGKEQADITPFPFALFSNEAGVPHMLYASDWNALQIVELSNLHNLTAAKSLIEEDAPVLRQIVLYHTSGEELCRITPEGGWELQDASLMWHEELQCFCIRGGNIGFAAVDRDGHVLYHKPDCPVMRYAEESGCFLTLEETGVTGRRLE